jgi:hypothetical protein
MTWRWGCCIFAVDFPLNSAIHNLFCSIAVLLGGRTPGGLRGVGLRHVADSLPKTLRSNTMLK